MLVSTKGRYALRILLELADREEGEYVSLDTIAAAQGISEKYLESIVRILVRADLVEGLRGRGGGYRLTRHPEDYSVGELLRLTEGSLSPVACLEKDYKGCSRWAECRTRPMWQKLDNMICKYLDSVSLADLMESKECSKQI